MSEATWTVSNDEFRMAFNATRRNAKRAGIDVNNPEVAVYIESEAEFIASLHAQARFLQNIIDKDFN